MSRTMLDELQARRLGLFNELSQSDTEADRYSDLATRHRDIAAGIRHKIADIDKAISALTPLSTDRGTALLDDQPETASPEFASEQGVTRRLLLADGSSYYIQRGLTVPDWISSIGYVEANDEDLPTDDDVRGILAEDETQFPAAPTEVRKQDEQDAAGDWTNGGEDRLDAVCAELLAAPPPAQEAPAIPEGFIPWGGGEYLPVARGTPLVVLYRNGSEVDCTAGDEMSEFWHRSSTLVDHSPDHDIIAYRVIETGETQSELDSSQIEGGDRVEPLHDRPKLTNEEFESLEKIDGVLDAEPSPILRSEVPPAAETYLAPSGDEFATVNGQTHLIVSDEAEAQGQAETAPQAAYAPIHNEDEPSDAAVFAHGLNVEIDAAKAQDQKFNPFWLFGGAKKTLVGEGV